MSGKGGGAAKPVIVTANLVEVKEVNVKEKGKDSQ